MVDEPQPWTIYDEGDEEKAVEQSLPKTLVGKEAEEPPSQIANVQYMGNYLKNWKLVCEYILSFKRSTPCNLYQPVAWE